MFKICKVKLIISFITVTMIGCISVKTFHIFHNEPTTIKKSQASNIKENYTKTVAVDSQSSKKNDDNNESNSLSDTKNSNDNYLNNSSNTNEQTANNSKLEKSINDSVKNNEIYSSSQSESTNINEKIENQNTTDIVVEPKNQTIYYDRTTSIYANDNVTLLRVEYYINNKLTYYSVVEQFDSATKSYIEKIYQCNRETNIDPLMRTDVYSNGKLIKSY